MSVTEALRAESSGPRHLGFIFGEVYHTPFPSRFFTQSCIEKETRIKDQSTVLAVILQLSQAAERDTWTSGDDDIKETQSVPCPKTRQLSLLNAYVGTTVFYSRWCIEQLAHAMHTNFSCSELWAINLTG